MAEGKKKSTASAKKNTAKKADTKKAASTAKRSRTAVQAQKDPVNQFWSVILFALSLIHI